jgi:hypothetical protein
VIKGPLRRQQSVGINSGIGSYGWPFFFGHCRNDFVEHCVGVPWNDEDANDREAAVLGRVYEVRLHGELLAIDEVFARMMEVKLY